MFADPGVSSYMAGCSGNILGKASPVDFRGYSSTATKHQSSLLHETTHVLHDSDQPIRFYL